jgi:PPE-repeat protein
VLDFGALPPEINSARMYAGAGPASLQAAASAWNSLAAELNSAAIGYDNVINQLVGEEWFGPASTAMANAAQPYIAWMNTTAAQAEQTANQLRTAVAAYEQAFAATVPPPLIAANRAQTAQLVATNVLGQNTPLIAQLEAQYSQMWAQDAAAMYGYAGQSAVATKVTPFSAPAQTADPAGSAIQSAAVNNAVTTAAATTSSQNVLHQLVSSTPSSLQNLATPAASTTATDPVSSFWSSSNPLFNNPIFQFLFGSTAPSSLSALLNDYSPYAGFFYNTEGLPYFSVGMGNSGIQMAKTLGLMGGSAPAAAGGAAKAAGGGLGALGGLLGGGAGGGVGAGSHVSAGLGNAGAVGGLTVPPSWVGGAPVAKPASPLPISSVSAAPESSGAGNLLGGMPLAGVGHGGAGAGPRYGFKPTVMARPPFAG